MLTQAGAKEIAKDSIKPAVTSQGTANAATYEKLKNQLHLQNLDNIAAEDPRLFNAMHAWKEIKPNRSGTVNFGIGSGSKAEADRLGKVWVGDGAKLVANQKECVGCLISADGTRIYRPPTAKPHTPKEINPTGVQANFSIRDKSTGRTLTNGHMDIK